ncbi:MAG: type II secretion system GspH family protein [Desulfobacterales bacterium]|nr:type II secretion system GspH family protein [Desulfobacterales bacterium]
MGRVDDKGFTLIELMVAVTLAAILFAAIGVGIHQVARGAASLEEAGESHQGMGDALEWMRRDLEALYVDPFPLFSPEGSIDEEDPYRFVITQESVGGAEVSMLRFTSRNHLSFGSDPAGGIAEIVYFVTEEDEGLVLRRSDRLFFHEPFDPGQSAPIAMTRLERFEVTATDSEGNVWSEWDSDDSGAGYATPFSVSVLLGRNRKDRAFRMSGVVKLHIHRTGALE